MTLSESQALDSFDFLGDEDTALLHRMSQVSCSDGSAGSGECAAVCHGYLLSSFLTSLRVPKLGFKDNWVIWGGGGEGG